MKEDFDKPGYGQEEFYFKNHDQELIQKRRKELDSLKKINSANSAEKWWMTCPKCGTKMQEINLGGILLDKCSKCQGIYFDAGELETLTRANESKGFFGALQKLMKF